MRENKEYAFRRFFSDIGQMAMSAIAMREDATLKFKGKVLMSLKEYPRLTKKNAFYAWYIRSTHLG